MAEIFSFKARPASSPDGASGEWLDDGQLVRFEQDASAGTTHASARLSRSIYATGWTNQELADLYRAFSLIRAAQPGLECDQGLSDDGSPWFVIGTPDGDTLIHICRIDAEYILDSVMLIHVLRGRTFKALVETFLDKAGLHNDKPSGPTNVVSLTGNSKVRLHPSMMLAALVWTLLSEMDGLVLPIPLQGEDGEALPYFHPEAPQESADNESAFSLDDAALLRPFTETQSAEAEADKQSVSLSLTSATALTAIAVALGLNSGSNALHAAWKSQEQERTDGDIKDSDASPDADISLSVADFSFTQLTDALAHLAQITNMQLFDVPPKDALREADQHDAVGSHSQPGEPEVEISQAVRGDVDTEASASSAIWQTFDLPSGSLAEEMMSARSQEQQLRVPAGKPEAAATSSDKAGVLSKASATLQQITNGLISNDIGVDVYDASSFAKSLGLSTDKVQDMFTDRPESISLGTADDAASLEDDSSETITTDQDAEISSTMFDAAAWRFLDDKLASNELDVVVFAHKVIFIDPAASMTDATSISWQLEDGAMISFIGMTSDFSDYLVA